MSGLARNYEQLTPRERLRLVLEAQGRQDIAEVGRLRDSCPMKHYRASEWAFRGPDDAVQSITLALSIDLARPLGHIQALSLMRDISAPLLMVAGIEAQQGDYKELDTLLKERSKAKRPCLDKASREQAVRDFDAQCSECLPRSLRFIHHIIDERVANHLVTIRGIVEGYGRFTRHMLGMEALEVFRAWCPPIADQIASISLEKVELDEALAAHVNALALDYWPRVG